MSIDSRKGRQSRQKSKTAEDRWEFVPGRLYDGVVVSTRKDGNACSVEIDNTKYIEPDCIVGQSVSSALLGFQIDYLPPPGTKVKLASGTPSVIVAMIPSNTKDPSMARNHYSLTGVDKTAIRDTKTFAGIGITDRTAHTPPRDLLEGEFQISNHLGVALAMLTTFARLSAGDRAKVEVFMLEDMVRIVSAKYRHFSAIGQQQIYDDGRANARLDATSYTHEALGVVDPKDERVKVDKNVVKLDEIDKVLETGRWRYSHFLGFLGDFFHLFVTDPVETAAKIGQEALRSGNAHVHIGSAGEVLVQSISEIALERVVRIPVPIEMKREDDPAGLLNKQYEELDEKFLKLWKYDTENPSKMVYQLREYARWLSTYHSLARFHQLQAKAGEWKVPSESECPEPKWTAAEADKVAANKEGRMLFKDTYACMRIMRDGSIVNLNGEGGAMYLAGKNGGISVPGHLNFDAGGDVRFAAGQSMYFLARRSMELVGVTGGIRLKARTWLQGLCERGSIWWKSDAVAPTDPSYVEPVASSNQMDGEQDPMPVFVGHGVFLDAPKSRVTAVGAGAIVASTKKGETDGSESDADVLIQADKASVRHIAGADLELRIRQRFLVTAGRDFVLKARKALWSLTGRLFDLKKQMTLRAGVVNAQTVKANSVSAINNFTGPDVYPTPPPNSPGFPPLKPHFNHIRRLPEDESAKKSFAPQPLGKNVDGSANAAEETDIANRDAFIEASPVIAPPTREGLWDFDKPEAYQWKDHPFYESLAQQRLRVDDELNAAYGTWSWADNKVMGGLFNGTNTPAVGTGAQHLRHDVSGKDLHKPLSGSSVDDLATQTPLTPSAITFKFLRKNPV